jgi:hypothetical protein
MSNRKLAKAIQNLTREVQKFYRQFNRAAVNWLLRSAFVAHRRGQSPLAGFVIPTAVLLILVLTLTVGAMTIRAFDRNIQVITNAQEKVIYNAATPAIDRARSKLEFLFDTSKDSRYPGGTPRESVLVGMLTNDDVTNGVGEFTIDGGKDPYTLPDETKVDLNLDGNNKNDMAWRFKSDTDGDGIADATVVYSVTFKTPAAAGGQSPPERLLTMTTQQKADEGIVRNGPLSSQANLTGCGDTANVTNPESGFTPEAWFQDVGSTSIIRKNFQVNTLVIPDNPKAAAVTLEFQQDRQILRGNKWGAWFRYDLEIFPGPKFNWNGAMHTEGNMFLGSPNGSNDEKGLEAYLVSSPASCLYQPESSELSITDQKPGAEASLGDFKGHVGMGLVGKEDFRDGTVPIHVQTGATAPAVVEIEPTNDASLEPASGKVGNVGSDPVTIVLDEKTQSVKSTDRNNRTQSGWDTKLNAQLKKRFNSKAERVPFVDDLYRADDRWGPKPKYNDKAEGRIPVGTAVGTLIADSGNPLSTTLLTSTPDATGNTPKPSGLDGYWERQAFVEGLRVIVGERLELGNIGGWVTPRDVDRNKYITPPTFSATNPPKFIDLKNAGANPLNSSELEGDPLYPPTVEPYPFASGSAPLPHLMQQRRSLRDNIPAVQSAAIYHAAAPRKDYPVACLAMTVHPGTPSTLRQSINFFPTNFKDNTAGGLQPANTYLLSDFFNGRGTDGWEYAPPAGDYAQFIGQLATGQPLRIALNNLANFAGDPDGAFPPKQEAGKIHPYPALTMWGNYSNLRRALTKLGGGSEANYNALSIADKSYIQTAACSLGLLATNVDQLQKFDPTNPGNDATWNNYSSRKVMGRLGELLGTLMDGDVGNGEVLPKVRLSTYGYSTTTNTPEVKKYNPADYYEVPPEAYVAGLKQLLIKDGDDYLDSPLVRMAELIMTSQQVRRDRTFGFRPSPAFGEYVITNNLGREIPALAFPSACDPDLFTFDDATIEASYREGTGTTASLLAESRKNTSLEDTATNWKLKPFLTTAYPNQFRFPGAVGSVNISSVAARRLALSRLCGAIRVPAGYTPGNALSDPSVRPVVLPKFPSLYYIFPEVAHGLTGAFVNVATDDAASAALPGGDVANLPGEWDHRQPGAIGPNRTVSNPPQGAVPAANDTAAFAAGLNPYDREPYITDEFVNSTVGTGDVFLPVSTAAPTNPRLLAYPTPTVAENTINPKPLTGIAASPTGAYFSRMPYANSSPFPVPDLLVSAIKLEPRQIGGFPSTAAPAVLPNYAPLADANNTSPNRIRVPKTANVATESVSTLTDANLPTKAWAVPFLDWAMFDGRQLEVTRVTDFDLGMLRSTKPANQSTGTEFPGNEPWLPMSGIVYAFREDAVREDGIERPPGGTVPASGVTNEQLIEGTAMNVTNPVAPFDPPLQKNGISIKAIDHLPDPDRRVHGFRLRNGTQLKRNPSIIDGVEESKNVRGISLITDQSVYLMGNFNLHQAGDGNEGTIGNLLEEFTEQLFPDNVKNQYKFNDFYNRATKEADFATAGGDRWRPSEILADAISILSNDFCDGSIADAFVAPAESAKSVPDFKANNGSGSGKFDFPKEGIKTKTYDKWGLYAPGCGKAEKTSSYLNHNRPLSTPPTDGNGWEWKREGASFIAPRDTSDNKPAWSDFTTPIQIGRTGEPLVIGRPIDQTPAAPQGPTLPVNYGQGGLGLTYVGPADERKDDKRVIGDAADTRVNAVVVSGLTPSRPNQSYGGLHNFPRFLEDWDQLFFSGSFLQLNFSNYATGPWENEGLEPGTKGTTAEPIRHYAPPNRLWGYDVALQLAPAGPISARFVAPAATRSEFYTEPPVSDPYINKLCVAAQAIPDLATKAKCVSQQN